MVAAIDGRSFRCRESRRRNDDAYAWPGGAARAVGSRRFLSSS